MCVLIYLCSRNDRRRQSGIVAAAAFILCDQTHVHVIQQCDAARVEKKTYVKEGVKLLMVKCIQTLKLSITMRHYLRKKYH